MYEPFVEHIGHNPVLGVYTDYYGLNYWPTSFGFRSALAAILLYIVGLIVFILYDIKPKKKMEKRIISDFRNIDRFGLSLDD